MASPTSLLLLPLLLLLSTASSHTCNSPNFKTPNKSFASCNSLPHLSASLHFTFNSSASTLSIAFSAAPSAPAGWIAWAINPDSPAMAGSQALLAFKSPNGSVSVDTYDLQSYSRINRGPLSYNVSDLAGEASGETLTVFGTWKLPEKTVRVNQVWQVGPSFTGGRPDKHSFAPANLAAKGVLDLMAQAPAPAPENNGAERDGVWLGFVLAVGFVMLV